MRINGFPAIPEGVSKEKEAGLKKLQKLSTEFESFFMKETIKAMRKTVPKDNFLNGGNAEEVYKSMYDDQMAIQMAKDGSSGIAQAMYRQLEKTYLSSHTVSTDKNSVAKIGGDR